MSSAAPPASCWQKAWADRAVTGTASPLSTLAGESFARFLARGFPTTRDEDWKYTSVAPIARASFACDAAPPEGLTPAEDVLLPALGGARLVFVNGQFSESLSSRCAEAAVSVGPLTSALAAGSDAARAHFNSLARARATAFSELNTAFMREGAFVHVGRNQEPGAPIHVVHVSLDDGGAGEPLAAQSRLLVVLEDGARASVIETHAGTAPGCLSNSVTELVLADGSLLDHVHVQRQADSASHVATTVARLGRDATLRSAVFSLGAALSRHDLGIELAGEGASCELDGLWFLTGSQHCDHHTLVDHAVPRTTSQQLYKGVHADRSQGVFNGKVIVRADAQGTAAHQQNRNLLLSRDALVDTKPELQIHANDVRCTHGATVGQIDDAQLFYLRSRGLSANEARRVLSAAFAAEIVERVKAPVLRESLGAQLALRQARVEAAP